MTDKDKTKDAAPEATPERKNPRDRSRWLLSLGSHLEGLARELNQGAEPDWSALSERMADQLGKSAPDGGVWKITYTAPKKEK